MSDQDQNAAAPKPSPVNDNAVAVNESAPVNDKPESAEAVAWAYRSEDPYNAGEWTITSIGAERPCRREVRPLVYGDTAPPRPEASAPVGVEK